MRTNDTALTVSWVRIRTVDAVALLIPAATRVCSKGSFSDLGEFSTRSPGDV